MYNDVLTHMKGYFTDWHTEVSMSSPSQNYTWMISSWYQTFRTVAEIFTLSWFATYNKVLLQFFTLLFILIKHQYFRIWVISMVILLQILGDPIFYNNLDGARVVGGERWCWKGARRARLRVGVGGVRQSVQGFPLYICIYNDCAPNTKTPWPTTSISTSLGIEPTCAKILCVNIVQTT